jgi:folylpolyglutamate synthase/dihydropteroate synthase
VADLEHWRSNCQQKVAHTQAAQKAKKQKKKKKLTFVCGSLHEWLDFDLAAELMKYLSHYSPVEFIHSQCKKK